ncbi:MAG: FliO/MopB family protein [Alphaproteobacteria bacterium]|nr:FliO/MopB family protein [Alphaproteobacteria bacterium]
MDVSQYFRFFLALVFVLGLIGVVGWTVRRFGFGQKIPITKNRDRRLAVVEVLPVDARRRLVLLRKDDRKHLVLLGPGQGSDLLIESATPAPDRPVDEAGKPQP